MCVCVGMRGCLYVCSGSPCKGGLIDWAAIPLKPLPSALDPFPDPLLNNQHKQKSVKHKGATDSTAFGNFFFIFGEHFLACETVLSDGGVPGQAGLPSLPYRGGEERTPGHPRGQREQGGM